MAILARCQKDWDTPECNERHPHGEESDYLGYSRVRACIDDCMQTVRASGIHSIVETCAFIMSTRYIINVHSR